MKAKTRKEKRPPVEGAGALGNAVECNYYNAIDSLEALMRTINAADGKLLRLNMEDRPWAKDDSEWFLGNPQRSMRVRPLYEHEKIPSNNATHALVMQHAPGMREKKHILFTSSAAVFDRRLNDDRYLMLLWQQLEERQ